MSKSKGIGEKPDRRKKKASLRSDGMALKTFKLCAMDVGTSVQKILETLGIDYPDTPKKGCS
ncbi:MAG: hypothetical protein R3186_02295 [Ruegeria sp.]|nr:hypothetical protein [Ruegeria sp.]